MKAKYIAQIAHEANRIYVGSLGDWSRPTWEEATEETRQGTIAGVEWVLTHPFVTAEEAHAKWKEHKRLSGWVHGPNLDSIVRTHENYTDLPAEERVKDELFLDIVDVLITTGE